MMYKNMMSKFNDLSKDRELRRHIEGTILPDTAELRMYPEDLMLFTLSIPDVGMKPNIAGSEWLVDSYDQKRRSFLLKRVFPAKEPQNPALYFTNPVFNHGVNLSVRRGTKWDALMDKTHVDIIDTLSGVIYATTSIMTRVLCFDDISNRDLNDEHDPEHRDRRGLLKSMEQTYPNFDAKEIVTLVYFEMP